MQDVRTMLAGMRRPGLLMQAARIGASEYRRGAHLRRYFGLRTPGRPAEALMRLLEIEGWQDTLRRAGDAGYSPRRHVDVMIAVLGEARLLEEARAGASGDQEKASGISALRRAT
ncbi:MAG: DUF6477 family protein [Pseudooceanicola sp.]